MSDDKPDLREQIANVFDECQSSADWCGSCATCGYKLADAMIAAFPVLSATIRPVQAFCPCPQCVELRAGGEASGG